MKKGTFVLMADHDSENFCRRVMLDGAMNGGLGVAAAGLPRHISLGLPYPVKDAYLAFAERLAAQMHAIEVRLADMRCAPVANGASGNYAFRFETLEDIDALRLFTVRALRGGLGLDVPEKDRITGSRSITLGFGKAPFEAYKAYVESADRAAFVGKVLRFDALGVFYYDEDTIGPNNFFCCKRIPLKYPFKMTDVVHPIKEVLP